MLWADLTALEGMLWADLTALEGMLWADLTALEGMLWADPTALERMLLADPTVLEGMLWGRSHCLGRTLCSHRPCCNIAIYQLVSKVHSDNHQNGLQSPLLNLKNYYSMVK